MIELRNREGFVLVAALWIVVAIGAVVLAASLESRARRNAVANILERTRARAAMSAGIEYARSQLSAALVGRADASRELEISGGPNRGRRSTAMLEPWREPQTLVDPTLEFGELIFDIEVLDARAKLNINRLTPEEFRNFFANGLGVDYALADRLAQAIADWRDPDDLPRVGGAERDDYLRAGASRLPANRPFTSVNELRYVLGMPHEVFEAARPYLTALAEEGDRSRDRVGDRINVNAAAGPVLSALPGMTPAAVDAILRGRESGVFLNSLDELMALLPASARETPSLRSQINRRIFFRTNMVELYVEGRLDGSPVRMGQRALILDGSYYFEGGQMREMSPGEAVVIMRAGK